MMIELFGWKLTSFVVQRLVKDENRSEGEFRRLEKWLKENADPAILKNFLTT
jgi:hypothetical protein